MNFVNCFSRIGTEAAGRTSDKAAGVPTDPGVAGSKYQQLDVLFLAKPPEQAEADAVAQRAVDARRHRSNSQGTRWATNTSLGVVNGCFFGQVFSTPKKKKPRNVIRARAMVCPVVSKHFYNVRTSEVDPTDVRHDASFLGFRPTVSARFPEAVAMRFRVLNIGKGTHYHQNQITDVTT